jgi:hypothetical protein
MAVTVTMYGQFPLNTLKKLLSDLNAGGSSIKMMLTTSSYSPNQDTHQCKSDVTNEVTGTGYTAGGAVLANKAVSYASKVTKFDADDVLWSNSTITARRGVLYDDTPAADADKKLILCIDFGENKSSNNGDFKIEFSASGIFTITVP